ncbi:MAG: radical SAM protein [Planctomycetota bacterium]
MVKCRECGGEDGNIAEVLGICGPCLRAHPQMGEEVGRRMRVQVRERAGVSPPPAGQGEGALVCGICTQECRMGEGETGLCGLRKREGGRLTRTAGPPGTARLDAYFDPHPTNCVGAWVCPAHTGAGYPKVARKRGPERGYKNLAVYYRACSFDCLNCQTTCICYFGGDPGPHLPHALRTSRIALEAARKAGRVLRICFETNGTLSPRLLGSVMEVVLESGGLLKFDLKAFSESTHYALTGSSNRAVLENFRTAASMLRHRVEPPPLMASTLMVPGYVNADEVEAIARFIASVDPSLPYSLLAFHPDFLLTDLPLTAKGEAREALVRARKTGLSRLHVGNIYLDL